MKSFLFVLFISFSSLTITAQTTYTYTNTGDSAILNGIVSKYILQNDTSFKWYASNQTGYTPDTTAVKAMEAAKNNVRYVIFGGTWCGDTRNVLPKFFKLQEKSGVGDDKISFFCHGQEQENNR